MSVEDPNIEIPAGGAVDVEAAPVTGVDPTAAAAKAAEVAAAAVVEYLRNQRRAIGSAVVGAEDVNGNRITKIYARGDEYVIYEVADLSPVESIRVYIHTQVEDDLVPVANFHQVKDRFDRLKSVMLKTGADTSYRHRAASAIASAIQGNVEDAKKHFIIIEEDAVDDYKHKIYGRLYYLLGAFLVSAVCGALALSMYLFRSTAFVAENPQLRCLSYVACFAALGGLFSISLKAREILAQRAINNWMYSIYGAERLLISLVAGVAAYALIKSGILFTKFSSGGSGIYFTLLAVLLSGFSETLIPNYLGKMENRGPE